jgi:signal transduction histidine kinase
MPIFYQTTWFVALCVAAVMASVGAVWRLHVLRVRKEFSLLLGERARLSREIHDTLLQSLFGVALQCDAIANDVALAAPSLRDQFMRMRHDVEEDIQDARQSIWNLRSPRLESHGLAAALKEIGEHATTSTPLHFTFEASGPSHTISPEVEEQLLRIGREGIVNAVRHARATTLRMTLAGDDRSVVLTVADDGRGFEPAACRQPGDHYGLTTMKERAESIGGTVSIVSSRGHGTVVTATIPRT